MELRFGWPLSKVRATGSCRSRVLVGSQEASHNRRSATPRRFAGRPRFRLWHFSDIRHGPRCPVVGVDAAPVRQLRAEGLGPSKIAKALSIGRASVYRALAEG